jgi:hypothetical protein
MTFRLPCVLGIKKLRFKPAYNPYTEPSMEVFSYHEGTYSISLSGGARGVGMRLAPHLILAELYQYSRA